MIQGYIYEEPSFIEGVSKNAYIEYWLNVYSKDGVGGNTMQGILERSSYYIEYMEKILEQEGRPKDLVYTVMVESKFLPCDKSNKGARGYWQFMPETARSYGLTVNENGGIDERCDLELATRAAARHFGDLQDKYKNWYMSLAAYNLGGPKLDRAIKLCGYRDFWKLAQYCNKVIYGQPVFPIETKNFVPKIIAMRKIARRPFSYGFYVVEQEAPLEFQWRFLRVSASLSDIARHLGVSHEELRRLNAKFVTGNILVKGNGVNIRIPL